MFGVVSHATLRLHPHAEVATGMIAFPWAEAEQVLENWHDVVTDDLDVMFGAMATPAGMVVHTLPMWLGHPGEDQEQLDRVRALGTPVLDQVARMPLADSVHALDEICPIGGHYAASSRVLPVPSKQAIRAFVDAAEIMPPTCMLNVHHLHGAAVHREGAYPYNEEHLVVEFVGRGDEAEPWTRKAEEIFDPHALPGGWPNLMRPDDPRARDAFGPNLNRLCDAKKRYDPGNVWRDIPELSTAQRLS